MNVFKFLFMNNFKWVKNTLNVKLMLTVLNKTKKKFYCYYLAKKAL